MTYEDLFQFVIMLANVIALVWNICKKEMTAHPSKVGDHFF